MFDNTSRKIKICAYVFFFVSILNQGSREIRMWFLLGSPSDAIIEMLLGTINSIVIYFIISLFVYGFAVIVQHFEEIKNDEHNEVEIGRIKDK